jgi:hypothetical protein
MEEKNVTAPFRVRKERRLKPAAIVQASTHIMLTLDREIGLG